MKQELIKWLWQMLDFILLLDPVIKYPFGIKNMNVSDERLAMVFKLKGGVFLGGEDNNPKHVSLPLCEKLKNKESIV